MCPTTQAWVSARMDEVIPPRELHQYQQGSEKRVGDGVLRQRPDCERDEQGEQEEREEQRERKE